jgi:predicted molibdopterin-dependent oxidoreductase YjgC
VQVDVGHDRSVVSLLWPEIEAASGLPRSALEMVAQTYAKSNATFVTYGMGITQHVTGTSNVHQIASPLLGAARLLRQGERHALL